MLLLTTASIRELLGETRRNFIFSFANVWNMQNFSDKMSVSPRMWELCPALLAALNSLRLNSLKRVSTFSQRGAHSQTENTQQLILLLCLLFGTFKSLWENRIKKQADFINLLRHLDMLYLACIYAAFAIHSLYFSTPVYESSTVALSKCVVCPVSVVARYNRKFVLSIFTITYFIFYFPV